jgi:hypothetical protein
VEEVVAVGAGAGASAAYLDAVAVGEEADHEVVVEGLEIERDDAEAIALPFREDPESRYGGEAREGAAQEFRLAAADGSAPHEFLELQREGRRMAPRKAGVPPSSRDSMSST